MMRAARRRSAHHAAQTRSHLRRFLDLSERAVCLLQRGPQLRRLRRPLLLYGASLASDTIGSATVASASSAGASAAVSISVSRANSATACVRASLSFVAYAERAPSLTRAWPGVLQFFANVDYAFMSCTAAAVRDSVAPAALAADAAVLRILDARQEGALLFRRSAARPREQQQLARERLGLRRGITAAADCSECGERARHIVCDRSR